MSADCHLLRPGFCLFCSVPGLCSLRFSFHQVGFLLQPLMAVSCPAGPSLPNPPSSFLRAPPHCVPALDSALEIHPGLCLAWGWALSPPPSSTVCSCSPAGSLSCGHHRPQRGLRVYVCNAQHMFVCTFTNIWMNFWYLKTLIRTKYCQYFNLLRA